MAKESYQKLKNDIWAFFENMTVAPIGSTFSYAYGTITKTGSNTAQYSTDAEGTVTIRKSDTPREIANRSKSLARYWYENYQVPWDYPRDTSAIESSTEKRSYQQLKRDIKTFFQDLQNFPVGENFDYAGGTLAKASNSLAYYTNTTDGVTIGIKPSMDPAQIAEKAPSLARYWYNNYKVPWSKPSATSAEEPVQEELVAPPPDEPTTVDNTPTETTTTTDNIDQYSSSVTVQVQTTDTPSEPEPTQDQAPTPAPDGKKSYRQLQDDVKEFFRNMSAAPAGRVYEYAGGTIDKISRYRGLFNYLGKQPVEIRPTSDLRAVAIASPPLARYWYDNYRVPWSRPPKDQGSSLIDQSGGTEVPSGPSEAPYILPEPVPQEGPTQEPPPETVEETPPERKSYTQLKADIRTYFQKNQNWPVGGTIPWANGELTKVSRNKATFTNPNVTDYVITPTKDPAKIARDVPELAIWWAQRYVTPWGEEGIQSPPGPAAPTDEAPQQPTDEAPQQPTDEAPQQPTDEAPQQPAGDGVASFLSDNALLIGGGLAVAGVLYYTMKEGSGSSRRKDDNKKSNR